MPTPAEWMDPEYRARLAAYASGHYGHFWRFAKHPDGRVRIIHCCERARQRMGQDYL